MPRNCTVLTFDYTDSPNFLEVSTLDFLSVFNHSGSLVTRQPEIGSNNVLALLEEKNHVFPAFFSSLSCLSHLPLSASKLWAAAVAVMTRLMVWSVGSRRIFAAIRPRCHRHRLGQQKCSPYLDNHSSSTTINQKKTGLFIELCKQVSFFF